LFFLQLAGSLGLVPLAALYERSLWQAGDPWPLIGALGILNLGAALALYRAFEYGVLSVVAPIISMAPAITTGLALAILGERPGRPALIGIVLVLAGTASLSRSSTPLRGPRAKDARIGLVSAFLALVGYGVFSFVLRYVVGGIGPITTVATVRLVGVAVVLAVRSVGRIHLATPSRRTWPLMLTVIVIDSAAFIVYTTGIGAGSVAIVATLTGLFSAVTVGLAAAILKERLRPAAYASIGVMLLGTALIVQG
jgi:drug/metabolite transporter (DMT)-like permease